MRIRRIALLAAALLGLVSRVDLQSQSCTCQLETGQSGGSLRAINWRLETDDQTPLSNFDERVRAAEKIWNDEFNRRDTLASSQAGPGDLRIILTGSMESGARYLDNVIWVASSEWRDPTVPDGYIVALISHELGHAFGFKQVSCTGQSLMSDTTRSSYRTAFTDCDQQQLSAYLGSPRPVRRDEDGDGYSPDDLEGTQWWDCSDIDYYVRNTCEFDRRAYCHDLQVWYDPTWGDCDYARPAWEDPILIPIGNGESFKLTDIAGGVMFDMNADGVKERTAWTASNSQLAFLAIDQNGNGQIDNGSELIGNRAMPGSADGFHALWRMLLAFGGARSESVRAGDPLYDRLLLWEDRNHDGVSATDELRPAKDLVIQVGLDYRSHNRKDGHGNEFRFRGWAEMRVIQGKDKTRTVHIYDVFFVVKDSWRTLTGGNTAKSELD